MNRTNLFVAAVGLLLAGFIGATLFHSTRKQAESEQHVEAHQAALFRDHAPSHGPRDAPVRIVEFFDPACETCRDFYFRVKADLLAKHPDRLRLDLRYAPFHAGSDQVVALLEASRRQDKFWPVLEALLSSQDRWVEHHTAQVDQVWPLLEGLGLDLSRLRTDMAAPEVVRVIEQDRADAAALNVTMTPEYFVNGRPLPSFGYQQLTGLVDDALREAGVH